jgi:dihydrofolate reductase
MPVADPAVAGQAAEAKLTNIRASVFIATSLDGFIAREDGGLDWLPIGGGEPYGYDEFIATVDAIVMGRKTFEIVLGFDPWPYKPKPVIVLSSRPETLRAPKGVACEFMGGSPQEIVDRLAKRGLKHLYIDGGVTIQRFLTAGLIQRMIITRIPVLLGSGVPLFGPLPHDVRLRHVATHAFSSGPVQSEYIIDS